jgi:hypothetical protein
MDKVFAAEKTRTGTTFVGARAGEAVIVEEEFGGKLRSLPLPKSPDGRKAVTLSSFTRPRLIATTNRAAMIWRGHAWWYDDGWKGRRVPAHGNFRPGNDATSPDDVLFLHGTVLYCGSDSGEWGGALAFMDLAARKPEWTEVPVSSGVTAITSPDQKSIWVATGLSHMGGHWRGLLRRSANGDWRTLMAGRLDEDRGALRLSEPSEINDLAVDAKGAIYLLAAECGVFRVDGSKLEPMLERRIRATLPDVGGCSPERLAIGAGGEVFVSTNCCGILAFKKEADGWRGKQIRLDAKAAAAR